MSVDTGPFGIGIAVEAGLDGQSLTPYLVAGTLSVVVELPKPFKDLDLDVGLEWRSDATPTVEDPWSAALLEHERCTESWRPATGGSTADDPAADAPVVPLDAHVLLAFTQPMDDPIPVADNPPAAAPEVAIGEHRASYSLTGLRLYRWRRSHPTARWEDVTGTVFGTWTADAGTRLQLLARSPFAFTRLTSRRWTDAFLAAYPAWPCGERPPDPVRTCVDWDGVAVGTRLPVSRPGGRDLLSSHVLIVVGRRRGGPGGGVGGRRGGPGADAGDAVVRAARGRRRGGRRGRRPGRRAVTLRAWAGGVELGSDRLAGGGRAAGRPRRRRDRRRHPGVGLQGRVAAGAVLLGAAGTVRRAAAWRAGRRGWRRRRSAGRATSPRSTPTAITCCRSPPGRCWRRAAPSCSGSSGTTRCSSRPAARPGWCPSGCPARRRRRRTPRGRFPHGGVLAILAPYVRWSIPDPAAVPVFRAYDLGCEFDASRVQQMYGADMRIRLATTTAGRRSTPPARSWSSTTRGRTRRPDPDDERVGLALPAGRLHRGGRVGRAGLRRPVRTAVPGLLYDDFSGDLVTGWTALCSTPRSPARPTGTRAAGSCPGRRCRRRRRLGELARQARHGLPGRRGRRRRLGGRDAGLGRGRQLRSRLPLAGPSDHYRFSRRRAAVPAWWRRARGCERALVVARRLRTNPVSDRLAVAGRRRPHPLPGRRAPRLRPRRAGGRGRAGAGASASTPGTATAAASTRCARGAGRGPALAPAWAHAPS